jgi:hypothetical protein
MKKAVVLAIRLYQLLLSPIFGRQCRFYPSCSSYTRHAVEKYGVLKGLALGGKRLLKCHPFHPGGVDYVP